MNRMGEHRTVDSRVIIDAFVELGEALGYDVRREWPIPGTDPHSERIDIAFFIDDKATTPAFAIEVDSSDAASSTSNAVKIFGKSTAALVKPYFVFHIFLKSASQGHRRQNTAVLLCTQNYKTYDFAEPQERTIFLKDLVVRHRAIQSTISLSAFGLAIDRPEWDAVDRYELLGLAARELDPGESELTDVAWLSVKSRNLKDALTDLVCSPRIESCSAADLSFVGQHFLWPLLFGLRAYAGEPSIAASAFREFREWQEQPEIIFSPTSSCLGLSQDFDFAIVELAPPVFCLVALLFQQQSVAAQQLCDQLYARATDEFLSPIWARYALTWCVIASIKNKYFATAQVALDKIDQLGGLPARIFPNLAAPGGNEDEESVWVTILKEGPNAKAPSIGVIEGGLNSLPPAQCPLTDLVARILFDNDFALVMHEEILRSRGNG
jgi:hypothetical protein